MLWLSLLSSKTRYHKLWTPGPMCLNVTPWSNAGRTIYFCSKQFPHLKIVIVRLTSHWEERRKELQFHVLSKILRQAGCTDLPLAYCFISITAKNFLVADWIVQKLADIDEANTAVCLNRLGVVHQILLGHKNRSVYTRSLWFIWLHKQFYLWHTYKAI